MENKVELKLSMHSKNARILGLHPIILAASAKKPIVRKITTQYYDTPDLTLLDAGISLCLRNISGRWIQSVKTEGSSLAGLHQRSQWESEVTNCQPDFTVDLDSALTKLFTDEKLIEDIRPIFQTKVQRTEWHLDFGNGNRIEMALDIGELVVGEKHEPISEIELELKSGKKGCLFELALELQKVIPLRLENNSKSHNGFGYYRAWPLKTYKPSPLKLKPSTKANNAFKKIICNCINHLQKSQEMVLYGTDVEGVHQMRVALRRLRSAFSMFRKLFHSESPDVLKSELDWLNSILGEARDLDVFITQTLPAIMAQIESHTGLLELHEKAELKKAHSYKIVREALLSQRYQCFLLTLGAWLESEHWCKSTHDFKEVKVFEISNNILQKRHRQLGQSGKGITGMNAEERHATRITAKKLRYAAEFFASLYSSRKTTAFIRGLSQLQDCLGVLNDINTTEKLMQQLIGSRPNRNIGEAKYICAGWNAHHATSNLEHLEEIWRTFTSLKKFWV